MWEENKVHTENLRGNEVFHYKSKPTSKEPRSLCWDNVLLAPLAQLKDSLSVKSRTCRPPLSALRDKLNLTVLPDRTTDEDSRL